MSKSEEKNKVIDKLTPEQEAKIPEYIEKFREIGLSTAPTDKAKAEKALTESYRYQKLADPKFYWVKDPYEGAKLAAQMAKGDLNVTTQEIRDQASKASFGSLEAQWVVSHSFICRELPIEHDGLIYTVEDIVKECGVYWTFVEPAAIVVCTKPTKISLDSERRLHCLDGYAFEFESGKGIYAYQGQWKASLMDVMLASKMQDTEGNQVEEK